MRPKRQRLMIFNKRIVDGHIRGDYLYNWWIDDEIVGFHCRQEQQQRQLAVWFELDEVFGMNSARGYWSDYSSMFDGRFSPDSDSESYISSSSTDSFYD